MAAAQDHFWRRPTLGAFISLLTGAFPFPRSGCEGLYRTERMLKGGLNVLLYPEGTRSHAGSVGEFQQGAAILAARGATIVPVGLYGSADVLPKGKKWPRRRPVAVVFGNPVPASDGCDSGELRLRVQHVADEAKLLASSARPTFFARIRDFATSSMAPRLMFLWAFAEALVWPIVPDFALLPLILVAPGRAVALVIAAIAGSVTGGSVAYLVGASSVGPSLLGVVPLVTDQMIQAAGHALSDRDALGLLDQPLSGIPYKVFALQAAPTGVDVPAYLAMSAVVRGARFIAVALAAAVLARLLRPLWERALHLFLVLYSVSFAVGLVRVVGSWGD